MLFWYLLVPALAVPMLGGRRIILAGALTTGAIAMVIVLQLTAPVNTGLGTPTKVFATAFIPSTVLSFSVLFLIITHAVRQIARAEAAAEREFERSEALLANILPAKVASRLKDSGGAVIADRYDDVSVLFADLAGFTAQASDTEPEDLVRFLNDVFTRLDGLVEKHGLEKIKTTGDGYLVVSGLPEPRADHAEALADLALEMRDTLKGLVDPSDRAVQVRIGIASGSVVAGVVGTRRFFYDVWGDAVNVAARMEQTGEPGRIQVSPKVHEGLKGRFAFEERGPVEIRGKGQMHTWFLSSKGSAS
jgi:adenylate cyclase